VGINETANAVTENMPGHPFIRLLRKQWVDKTLAILACIPFVLPILFGFKAIPFDIPNTIYVLQISLCALTLLIRRTPVRVTSDPLLWLLTLLATYWGFLTIGYWTSGTPVAPRWATDSLAITSLAIMVWARVSLGRNIGLVPAQRNIVTDGAYRFVRHPIYTAVFFSIVATGLSAYSPVNTVLFALGIFWWIVKSLVEENFLRKDPEYAAYLERVRWRWIPGII
jgi:protein-S-isoprenylcysteine O-methyltransferase Ste14